MAQLDDLKLFLAVVDCGSFTAVTERLGVPKSTVSRAVARLEASLGNRLVERSTRHVRLTEAGKLLHAQSAPLLGRLGELLDGARQDSAAPQGTLRIAAPYEFGVLRLGDILTALLKQHPGLQAEVDLLSRVPDTRAQDYDIVFRVQTDALPDSAQVARRMYALHRGLYAAPELVARLGAPHRVDELTAWPCLVSPDEPIWSFQDGQGQVRECEPHGPLRSQHAGLRMRAALAGLGATLLSSTICREELASGRLVRLLPDWQPAMTRVYALLPSRRHMPAKVRVLLDWLARELSQLDVETLPGGPRS
ncbi:LysR family transcriptional regulator [Aquabacterium sp.]|uniref:LysR family transcriptional regulator n=1 Tax=Aquabacterium sp. TaxID=1872578 RepID=UPI0035B4017C